MIHSRVAVIGGTGSQGKGLAYRFARGGHDVVVGSRSPARASAVVEAISARLDSAHAGSVSAASNEAACADADVIVLAIPFDVQDALVAVLPLVGKVVISCVNPLTFDQCGIHSRPVEAGHSSAAETTQRAAPGARLVGAFHHVSATRLWSDVAHLDEDVLVVGDDQQAKQTVMALIVSLTGRPGVDAGELKLARQLESFTAVLISIKRQYKAYVGIRVTGIPVRASEAACEPVDRKPARAPS